MGKLIFDNEPEYWSIGRNGHVRTTGLMVNVLNDTVSMNAITSRGDVSEGTRLVLPVAEIDRYVEVLRSAKLLYSMTGRTEILTMNEIDTLVRDDLVRALQSAFHLFPRSMQHGYLTDPSNFIRHSAYYGAFAHANRNNRDASVRRNSHSIDVADLQAMGNADKVLVINRAWWSLTEEARNAAYAMPINELLALMDEGPKVPAEPASEDASEMPAP